MALSIYFHHFIIKHVQLLANHYHPNIARLAKVFEAGHLEKKPFDCTQIDPDVEFACFFFFFCFLCVQLVFLCHDD